MLRLLFIMLGTIPEVMARRLLRGPKHPSWGPMFEIMVTAGRRAIGSDPDGFVERLRALPSTPLPRSLARQVRVEEAAFGGVPARVLTPDSWKQGAPTCVYAHGGGYVSGSSEQVAEMNARLAIATGHRVVSLDYRLAPEHPYPAALDDAVAAWTALRDGSNGRTWVAGDSAGAGLVIALCVRLRDEQVALPSCCVAFSPYVDISRTARPQANAPLDLITSPPLATLARAYTGNERADHPYLSPVFADLAGLPPMLVVVGGAELLKPEIDLFVERASAANVDMEQLVGDGMPHVYPSFAAFSMDGEAAFERAAAFARRHCGNDGCAQA